MEILKKTINGLLARMGYVMVRAENERHVIVRRNSGAASMVIIKWLVDLDIRTVLDVGAHDGFSAEFFHKIFPEAAIYSFEPLQEEYEKLRKKMQSIKNLKALNYALGDEDGETVVNKNEFSPSSSLLNMTSLHKEAFPFTDRQSREKAHMRKLDSLTGEINLKKNILMKLDVQGFEDKVLAGAHNTLKKIKILIVETSFRELYEGQPDFAAIYELLKSAGFAYKGSWDQLCDPRDGAPLQQDAIFLNTHQ